MPPKQSRNWIHHEIIFINYINGKFKDMTLEDASQEKALYTKNTFTLVFCCQNTVNHRTSNKYGITKIHNIAKAGVCPSKINLRT